MLQADRTRQHRDVHLSNKVKLALLEHRGKAQRSVRASAGYLFAGLILQHHHHLDMSVTRRSLRRRRDERGFALGIKPTESDLTRTRGVPLARRLVDQMCDLLHVLLKTRPKEAERKSF